MNPSFKFSTLVISCSLALTACGSGGGSTPSTTPTNTSSQSSSNYISEYTEAAKNAANDTNNEVNNTIAQAANLNTAVSNGTLQSSTNSNTAADTAQASSTQAATAAKRSNATLSSKQEYLNQAKQFQNATATLSNNATQAVNEAQTAVNTAAKAVEQAQTALTQAEKLLSQAQNDVFSFNIDIKSSQEQKTTAQANLSAARAIKTQAETTLDSAQSVKQTADENLAAAKTAKTHADKLTQSAQQAVAEAEKLVAAHTNTDTNSTPTPKPTEPSAAKKEADNKIAAILAKAAEVKAAARANADTNNDGTISEAEATAANDKIKVAKAALNQAIAEAQTATLSDGLSDSEKQQATDALNKAKSAAETQEALATVDVKASEPSQQPDKQPEPPVTQDEHSGFGYDNNHVMSSNLDGGLMVSEGGMSAKADYQTTLAPQSTNKNVVILPASSNADAAYIKTEKVTKDAFTTDERTTGLDKTPNSDTFNEEKAVYQSIHSGDLLPDVRYGAAVDISNVRNIRQALFVQGTPASADTVAALQKTATYKGTGLHFGQATMSATQGLPFMTATTSFAAMPSLVNLYSNARATDVNAAVDFDKKTVDVTISAPQSSGKTKGVTNAVLDEPLLFSGTISGNTFRSSNDNLKGGFFGANADQLAGMYQADDQATGVFGAAKTTAANTSTDTSNNNTSSGNQAGNSDNIVAHASTYYTADTAEKTLVKSSSDSFANLRTLIVNGVAIELPQNSDNSLSKASSYEAYGNLQNVVYGAAAANGKQLLFVQGNPTDTATITDTVAKYVGNVLHYRARVLNDGTLVGRNDYTTTGSFTANADFANKSLNVKINSGDRYYMGEQNFTAVINGNAFSGNVPDGQKSWEIEGGFYGNNAAEIAGKYRYSDGIASSYSSNSGFGVFGGTKVAQ